MAFSRSGPRTLWLPALDGMRFVAASIVFLFHFAYQFPFRDTEVGEWYSRLVGRAGPMQVGFFFVLSGFILTMVAKPGEPLRRFYRRRTAKIYPNHVVAWALAAVTMLALGIPIAAHSAIPNLFLIHPWFPPMDITFSMDFVSWSMACEVVFYLCFPLLYKLVGRIRPQRLWWWAAGLAAAMWVVPFVAELLPDRPMFYTIPARHVWFIQMFPPVRALDFVLGMVMACIVLEEKWIRLGLYPALGLLFCGYLLASNVPEPWSFVAATGAPIALVVAAAATADMKGLSSPFRSRPVVRLGELSFAFYLVHWQILNFGHVALGAKRQWSTPVAITLGVTAYVVSWCLAWVLHTLVEVPAMRRFGRPRPLPRPEPAAPDAALPVPDAGGRPVGVPGSLPPSGPDAG
ncbi:acyltransferase family protein [Streptomyces sp. NPDC013157]|uniref:acyltransferase family protein n=1 Tax=Streptomyces sp. NPDC013157 TaxID=3364861 RepID=UPI0036A0A099